MATIVGRAASNLTHGEFSFLIDEDVLLAYFQLVSAVYFHIRLGIDNRLNLGVGSTNYFTLDIALDSLGMNRGGLGDSEGLSVFSKFAIIEGVHEVGTFLIVGDAYAEAVFKLLRFRQRGCSNSHGRRITSILNIQDSRFLAARVASKTGASGIVLKNAALIVPALQDNTVVGSSSVPLFVKGNSARGIVGGSERIATNPGNKMIFVKLENPTSLIAIGFVSSQLKNGSTLDVYGFVVDGNGYGCAVHGAGGAEGTHTDISFLIDEDVLLADFQLVNAGHLHIGVSSPCRHSQHAKCK